MALRREGQMGKARRYTRAYAEAEAKKGNVDEIVATNVYLTLAQLDKIDRLIEKRQADDSAKLGRKAARMSVTDFFRVLIDEIPEGDRDGAQR
jgi:hypothetical protein